MTKEELSRGIQEIDADLVAEAAFDAHTPESGRAEEPTRILVARKRRSGLRAVGLLAAALAVVVAVSAIVAWKPFSRHKSADEAKLSGDGCGALYQMTAHETVRVEGSGFSEDWLPVYVQSQAGTIAAAVRAEYGITGEIRVCTNGNLIAPRNYESAGFVLYDRKENKETPFSGDYLYYKIPLQDENRGRFLFSLSNG